MYKIFANGELIYDSTSEDFKIGKGEVTREVDKSGSFVFSVYPEHPFYDKFVKLKTVIMVTKFEKIIFRGRILNDVTDYHNNKVLTCEGELGFLQDSIVRPFTFTGTVEEFFKKWIEQHNSQVDDFKKFKIGKVTVTDSNNNVPRYSDVYQTTFESMSDRLIESELGGHFFITHGEDGKEEIPTLNYLADFEHVSEQIIEFGENLKNYTKTVKAEDIATAIIPLGATVEDNSDSESDSEDNEDPEEDKTDTEENGEKPKLTIASVNGGKDYVYSKEAVELYGWIFKVVEWSEVGDPNTLKKNAEEYLDDAIMQSITLELNAIDLHLLDRNIESFSVCDYVRVLSAPHKLDALLLCNKQTFNLLNPANDGIVLGQTYNYFTRNNNKLSHSVGNITTKIENQITSINQTINTISVQVIESQNVDLKPNIYQVFGEVDSLHVNLVPTDNNLINEYCFEFIPTENFTELTITPAIRWANAPQYPAGKTCQVSIVRDVGVFVCA